MIYLGFGQRSIQGFRHGRQIPYILRGHVVWRGSFGGEGFAQFHGMFHKYDGRSRNVDIRSMVTQVHEYSYIFKFWPHTSGYIYTYL